MLSSMTISTLTMMLLINMMSNSLPFGVSDSKTMEYTFCFNVSLCRKCCHRV